MRWFDMAPTLRLSLFSFQRSNDSIRILAAAVCVCAKNASNFIYLTTVCQALLLIIFKLFFGHPAGWKRIRISSSRLKDQSKTQWQNPAESTRIRIICQHYFHNFLKFFWSGQIRLNYLFFIYFLSISLFYDIVFSRIAKESQRPGHLYPWCLPPHHPHADRSSRPHPAGSAAWLRCRILQAPPSETV